MIQGTFTHNGTPIELGPITSIHLAPRRSPLPNGEPGAPYWDIPEIRITRERAIDCQDGQASDADNQIIELASETGTASYFSGEITVERAGVEAPASTVRWDFGHISYYEQHAEDAVGGNGGGIIQEVIGVSVTELFVNDSPFTRRPSRQT